MGDLNELVARLRIGTPENPEYGVVWVQNLRAHFKEGIFSHQYFPEWNDFLANVNALLSASEEAAAALTSLIAERDGLAKALEQAKDDTARLDYLDSLNASLNARHGTKYGWAMVVNQNVNRVMFNFPRGADLSDYNPHGFRSCRTAIDQRMAETAAYRRALSLDTNKGDGV